ncbi:hypothetical protein AB4305_33435 [Nocardia sp. 2YAB30]|uniref:hypothetical protein n=1 Tax=Nocardia sp. 2YAB30 TaxID=3233022 RepID=UPI003F975153
MFKDILTVYGKGTHARSDIQDYIADSHRSLVMQLPVFTAIFTYYSMHRVHNAPVTVNLVPYRYDGDMLIVAPHATHSLESWIEGMTHPEYLDKVKPDAAYMWTEFVGDRTAAYNVEAHQRFDSDTLPGTAAFDFLVRSQDVTAEEFSSQLAHAADALRRDPQYRAVVRRRIDNLPTGTASMYAPAGSEYDAIIETWVTDHESLATVRDSVRRAYAPFITESRCRSVLTSEKVAVDASRPHRAAEHRG